MDSMTPRQGRGGWRLGPVGRATSAPQAIVAASNPPRLPFPRAALCEKTILATPLRVTWRDSLTAEVEIVLDQHQNSILQWSGLDSIRAVVILRSLSLLLFDIKSDYLP